MASENPGKAREMSHHLAEAGITVVSLRELGLSQVEETGDSFHANAQLKAVSAAKASGLWALGEDSGLEVDALGGRPGVMSARYAGPGATDEKNVRKLLEELRGVPLAKREARFRSVMVLSDPTGGLTWTSEGTCAGTIAEAPRGDGGFGYDPVFVPVGEARTFAEMSQAEKERMSHRGKALEGLLSIVSYLRSSGQMA